MTFSSAFYCNQFHPSVPLEFSRPALIARAGPLHSLGEKLCHPSHWSVVTRACIEPTATFRMYQKTKHWQVIAAFKFVI